MLLLVLSTKVRTLPEASSDRHDVAEFRQRQWLPAATALTERSSVDGAVLPAVTAPSTTSSFHYHHFNGHFPGKSWFLPPRYENKNV